MAHPRHFPGLARLALAQAPAPTVLRAAAPLTATLRQAGTEQVAAVARSGAAASVQAVANVAHLVPPVHSADMAMRALTNATSERPAEHLSVYQRSTLLQKFLQPASDPMKTACASIA